MKNLSRLTKYISCKRSVSTILVVLFFHHLSVRQAHAHRQGTSPPAPPLFWGYFGKYIKKGISGYDPAQERRPWIPESRDITLSSSSRRPLSDGDDDIDSREEAEGVTSVSFLRAKISQHNVKLGRLKQEAKDLAHERVFLEKTLQLKKGQRTMQDGQVKLSQVELEDKAREIEMYRREAPRTVSKYNELVRKQREMQETLNRLHRVSEELSSSKEVILEKIQHLSMEDLIERHARGLPDAMAGALRKSAAAVTPFFDYLLIAADTNNRLVDHVGAEIDKYTHVNISQSPFLSGILFYCVMLVPLLTLISFVRRVFDSSSKLTVSHYIILGNCYFVVMCLLNLIVTLFLGDDPMKVLFRRFERLFIVGNLALSIYFSWHIVMLGLQAIYTMETRNISQFTATLSVGIHYFLFAWRKVFTDSTPNMYPVNYLVYGTIFSFILYERYNRLSNKQLNENGIFRFIYAATKRKTHLSTFQGLQLLTSELWRSLPSAYTQLPRRFPRRRNRGVVSSSNKSKADAKERSKTRRKVSYLPSSEDEEANDVANRFRSTSRLNEKEVQKRSQEEGRPPERGGFLRMFFGNRENDSDSNDGEEEAPPQRIGGWRMLRAATTDTVVETRRSGRGATTLTNGSHGTREGREAAAARPSIWKWPSGSGKTPIEDEAVGRRHAARRGRS